MAHRAAGVIAVRMGCGRLMAYAFWRAHRLRPEGLIGVSVERLGEGMVHLSAIKLLSPHLTEGNHVQLLDRVRGRTKRKIMGQAS